ncbi:MAG: hypothetical protein JXJ20_06715 [Anaerolineae bacterium]|nr:hypothetical protein [Anaerolineae bacterium]
MSNPEPATPNAPLSPITRLLLVTVIAVACLALIMRLVPHPRTIDDAFITFRYSRNIVDGQGFVYNPGSRTLGTTTPLYTVLMAGIGFVTGSEQYPWFALIVNALADAGTAALLVLLVYRLTGSLIPAAVLGGLWAISPMSVTFAIGGMETSVAILWSVAAVYLYLIRRDRWMAACAALGVLTRVDALIWAGPLLLHQAITCWLKTRSLPAGGLCGLLKRLPWPSWLVFGGVLLPWYLFSLAYFGTLLSRSLSAKQLAYVVGDWHALTRLLQHIATPFFEQDILGVPGIVIGIVLYPGLAWIGTVYAIKRQPRLLPFLLYPWLYVVVFSIMNPLIFRWYLAPLLPAYFLALWLGVWALADSAATSIKQLRLRSAVVLVLGATLTIFSFHAWTLHPDHSPDYPAPDMAWHEIELYYQDMGEMLHDDFGVTGDTVVAAGDIGAVGYYSRAHILDTVGLITPEITRYYPLDRDLLEPDQNYAVPPAIIFDYQPDYIVFMEMFVRKGLALDPAFEQLYAEVAFIPTDFYGDGMILYQRRDLAEGTSGEP